MSDNAANESDVARAGLLRRFGAMFYDLLLVIALLMVITAVLLPLTGGEAITFERHGAWEFAYQVLLVATVVGFFGWFWTRRGQTLGMMAWRLKLVRDDGAKLTWVDTVKRLGAALVSWIPLGLGFFWVWFDSERLAWHDRWTRTRIVLLPKR